MAWTAAATIEKRLMHQNQYRLSITGLRFSAPVFTDCMLKEPLIYSHIMVATVAWRDEINRLDCFDCWVMLLQP